MNIPVGFAEQTQALLGSDEYERLLSSLLQEAPVSVRLNPWKKEAVTLPGSEPVAWCSNGFYLKERPTFTFDPLFHAGCYYVQEASSMFIEQAIGQCVDRRPVVALDLCAAPGGKSTHLRSLLAEGSLLVANEVIRNRSRILSENLVKWGHPDVMVTNNDPADFKKLEGLFDLIVADVPCSGEGMFRKDPGAVEEWSLENVEICWQRQRRIIADIWPALKPGGVLIYSTCTYNTKENEENIRWITEEFGAEVLVVDVPSEWNITGNLLGEEFPVYRFLPHKTLGEGFFLAALRKADGDSRYFSDPKATLRKSLRVVQDFGVETGQQKGKDIIPSHAEAVSITLQEGKYSAYELTYEQAIAYLRKEAIVLPADTPRGHLLVTYKQVPLGFVKNIGNRANNLYPQEWRIRSGYLPEEIRVL